MTFSSGSPVQWASPVQFQLVTGNNWTTGSNKKNVVTSSAAEQLLCGLRWRSRLPVKTWGQQTAWYLRGFLKPTRVQPAINKDGHCISLYSFSIKTLTYQKGPSYTKSHCWLCWGLLVEWGRNSSCAAHSENHNNKHRNSSNWCSSMQVNAVMTQFSRYRVIRWAWHQRKTAQIVYLWTGVYFCCR